MRSRKTDHDPTSADLAGISGAEKKRTRAETIRRYGFRSIVGAVAISAAAAGCEAGRATIREYDIQKFIEAQRQPDVDIEEGTAQVETLEVGIDEYCTTAYTARIENVKTRLTDKENEDKYRQAETDSDLLIELCVNSTAGDVVIDREATPIKYDIYIPDTEAIYVKAGIDYRGVTIDPDGNVKIEDRLPLSFSLSGSSSTTVERSLNEFLNNSDITLPFEQLRNAQALQSAKISAQDSFLVSVSQVKALQMGVDCASDIYPVAEDDVKRGIAKQPKKWAPTGDKSLDGAEYRVFIGDESPSGNNGTLTPRFEYDYETAIAKLTLDNPGMNISEGEVTKCERASDFEVVERGES